MKRLPILAAAVGVAAIAALIGYFGAGAVMRSLLSVGGLGFAVICAIHLVLVAVMGFAWGGLMPGAPAWTAIWGRLVRDSGSELLVCPCHGAVFDPAHQGRVLAGPTQKALLELPLTIDPSTGAISSTV